MRRIALRLLLTGLLGALPVAGHATDTPAPLVLERSIPLADVTGRIDHMAIDLGRNRLLVAELGNDTVDAIDLGTGNAVHRLNGLRHPQGIGYAPQADVIAIASAGDGSVHLFRGDDFAAVGTVDLGDDADDIRLDPTSGQLIVGYGTGGLAFLDPASHSVVRLVKLPAHPEGFQIDPSTQRAFVNVPDADQISVIDLATGKQAETWQLPGLRANFPMALIPTGPFVASVFRDPARLVLLDPRTGAARPEVATCSDADDVFFDAKRERIYVSCGAGAVDVFHRNKTGYSLLTRIKTAAGARTSLFVPELDRLFVAARAGWMGLGSDAAILVLRPQP